MEMTMNEQAKISNVTNFNPLKKVEQIFTYEPVFGFAIWACVVALVA